MRRGIPVHLFFICFAAIAGCTLLLAQNRTVDEAQYAEVPSAEAQSLPPAASSTEKFSLPILVYHIVRPSYPNDSQAVRNIALTPEAFDAEMKYLADAGYRVVAFRDLENYVRGGAPLPGKPVILSFDDGWSDQFQYAFPILQKYRYPATFFVFTNSIGKRGFVSWDELLALRDAGMTIGSHSRSHPYLTRVSNPAVLWDEINGSKQALESRLGAAVTEFAYPFGRYDASTTAAVQRAGYLSARGDLYTGMQSASLLYALSAMNAPTTTALFAKKFP
jgi:peptidoglycan/xylan/chitin deacetylase (PgdA/CDA1 family)